MVVLRCLAFLYSHTIFTCSGCVLDAAFDGYMYSYFNLQAALTPVDLFKPNMRVSQNFGNDREFS